MNNEHFSKKSNYYCQGIYTPSKKYKGVLPCVYRSEPERKIMMWLDKNDNIIEWTSESVVVPYIKPTDNKVHRYFIDFSCLFRDKNSGKTEKYLLEYKPYKHTLPPTKTTRKKDRTFLIEVVNYSVNQAKWKAAREYAKAHNMTFLVINEKHIGLDK